MNCFTNAVTFTHTLLRHRLPLSDQRALHMHSDDSNGPSGSTDASDQAAPGWLFVVPRPPRHVGGVDQVVDALVGQFRDGREFSPQLLVGTEELASGGTVEADLIKAHYLPLWSPVDHQHPFRAAFSFVYRLPYRCWVMRRIINQRNIKIINPHFPGLASLVFLVLKNLKLFKGKIILSFHGSDVRDALCSRGRERKLWWMLLRGADHIVVVSDDLAKDVLALDSTVAAKITTIYNGVDLALFTPAKQEQVARLSLPNQGKTILSIGAFVRIKGHDTLVRAFSHVLRQLPDARLVLVGGNGPELEPIRHLIKSLLLEDKVVISTDVPHEQIPAFLSQAQLFVLASRREGFGLVVTEAAAAKVPIVCTKAHGLRELITDGVTGRLVEIDNHNALADTIVDVLTHPDEAERMALKFYDYVTNNLTWHQSYERYIQLCR
jgi:L-malate glycosyltransferase